jgi:hypothetical protein
MEQRWLDSNWRRRWSLPSLRAKGVSRLVSSLTVVIVIVTFVLKEGYRDRIKDDLESLNAAEARFALLKAVSPIDVVWGVLNRRIGEAEARLGPKQDRERISPQMALDEQNAMDMDVDELIEVLPLFFGFLSLLARRL